MNVIKDLSRFTLPIRCHIKLFSVECFLTIRERKILDNFKSSTSCYSVMASPTLKCPGYPDGRTSRSESPSHRDEEKDEQPIQSKPLSQNESSSESANQISRRERKRVCLTVETASRIIRASFQLPLDTMIYS